MNSSNTLGEPGVGFELKVVRHFAAPRALVFDCFTKAEHLARWWGPHGFDAPLCETDARPGGKIRIDMRGPEPYGTNPLDGEYVEVAPPEKLVWVLRGFPGDPGEWGIEHISTLTFSDDGAGGTVMHMTTRVTTVSEELLPALRGMDQGWEQSFEKLDALLPQLG